MRILALSDIHRAYDRATKILEAETAIDVVLVAGDLTTGGNRTEAAGAIARLRAVVPRVFAVAGNMDSRDIDASFVEDGIGINGKGISIGDVGLFGVSGCPVSPLHTPYEISEEAILALAEEGWHQVAGARWKIFVSHAPPYGTKLDVIAGGRHVGSTAVRRFVEERQPDLVVCGHIHESAGLDAIGSTRMINCGSVRDGRYAVLEFGDGIAIVPKVAGMMK